MADQLWELRRATGISYLCVRDLALEAFAPIVRRLAGR